MGGFGSSRSTRGTSRLGGGGGGGTGARVSRQEVFQKFGRRISNTEFFQEYGYYPKTKKRRRVPARVDRSQNMKLARLEGAIEALKGRG